MFLTARKYLELRKDLRDNLRTYRGNHNKNFIDISKDIESGTDERTACAKKARYITYEELLQAYYDLRENKTQLTSKIIEIPFLIKLKTNKLLKKVQGAKTEYRHRIYFPLELTRYEKEKYALEARRRNDQSR
jgi:hypothetical protein